MSAILVASEKSFMQPTAYLIQKNANAYKIIAKITMRIYQYFVMYH
jgi:hypothetical protein